jgi:hypothetical protein
MPRFYQNNRSGNHRRGNSQSGMRNSFGYLSLQETCNQSNELEIKNSSIKEDSEEACAYKRNASARNYISRLSIDELTKLNTENQDFIYRTASLINTKALYGSDMHRAKKRIQDLENSLKVDYPPHLEQLARKQLSTATDNLASLDMTLTSIIDATRDTIDHIQSKFPEYDFTLAPEMSEYITETLKDKRATQEKNAHREKLLLEKKKLEDSKKQLLLKKSNYVVNHVIGFLSRECEADGSVFEPCMANMSRECYLNELISKAHMKHYQAICQHEIDFDEPYDDDYFINRWTIEADRHKRYATVASVDIIKFENDDGFDLDSSECSCHIGERID